jgi:hypothetical protein
VPPGGIEANAPLILRKLLTLRTARTLTNQCDNQRFRFRNIPSSSSVASKCMRRWVLINAVKWVLAPPLPVI